MENPTVKTPPEKGTVEIKEDGTIIYKPGEDFDGEDKFTITVETEDGELDIFIDVFEEIPEGLELPKTGGLPMVFYAIIGCWSIVIGVKIKFDRLLV